MDLGLKGKPLTKMRPPSTSMVVWKRTHFYYRYILVILLMVNNASEITPKSLARDSFLFVKNAEKKQHTNDDGETIIH